MDCLHPVTISIPVAYGQDDIRNEKCSVPCGKCAACIVSSANEWRVRLQIEKEHCDNCYFVTLTYSDDTLPIDVFTDSFGAKHIIPYVCKRDCQNFFKRLRKRFENSEIRYYLVSEYGPTTLRPHYHSYYLIYRYYQLRLYRERLRQLRLSKNVGLMDL